jgi:hypothetical protein
MKTHFLVFAATVLASVLGGLARAEETTPAAGKGAPEAQFTRIVCSDSGGFTGRGTGKWLSIDGSGKLQVKRSDGGVVDGQLNPQQLAELAADVAAVDWSTVEKQYKARGADMIQNDLSVTVGGKTHVTHAVIPSAGVPGTLKTLFSRLAALHRQFAPAKK